MKTYLVTGGAGFIGSNFILYMLSRYPDIKIINCDKLTYAGNLENLSGVRDNCRYSFIHGDICDKELIENLFKSEDIDYVVNFAAESHVDRSITDPEIFVKTNVEGTVTLLNAAKKAWEIESGFKTGKKFIQISTDEVYGSLGEFGLFSELTPINPHSPYSSSKAAADLMVRAWYDTYGLPVNITRCSNNYGPYQLPEKLIPMVLSSCLDYKNVPVYGDGMNIRDWLYVEDHCSAIDIVIQQGEHGEVYNIGGSNERTNIQIVNTIICYLKDIDKEISEELITFVKDRKGHDRRYGVDSSKIRNKLGWVPGTDFQKGIQKTMDWYLNNRRWLNNAADRFVGESIKVSKMRR